MANTELYLVYRGYAKVARRRSLRRHIAPPHLIVVQLTQLMSTAMSHNKRQAGPEPVTNEVYVRRLPIDEAILKLDKYLNDAFMAGFYQIKVVHGKGTGTLRQVVQEQLNSHPLVESHRPGRYGEGGAGVTIVELALK
ncbi:Smr/MutS family protein [Chloroflexota bacterium]